MLLQKERAGSVALEKYYQEQIDRVIKEQRPRRINSLEFEEVSEQAKTRYYSHWKYQTLWCLAPIKDLNHQRIAQITGLRESEVVDTITFLVEHKMLLKTGSEDYTSHPDLKTLMLPPNHPLSITSHINSRLLAIEKLKVRRAGSLHYSSAICLSKEDAKKAEEILTETVHKIQKLVSHSKQEEVFQFNVDFVNLSS